MIVAMEAKSAGEGIDNIEDRLLACMKASVNHWMAVNEDDQFRGAVTAAYDLSNDDEKRRIEGTMKVLNALSVATTGIPVDLARVDTESFEPLPLVKLWQRAKGSVSPSQAEAAQASRAGK